MIMEPARIETRRSYLAEYTTTPNISYNMPSFLSQNQQEYPLSFFSYIYTKERIKKKKGTRRNIIFRFRYRRALVSTLGCPIVSTISLSLEQRVTGRRSINSGEYFRAHPSSRSSVHPRTIPFHIVSVAVGTLRLPPSENNNKRGFHGDPR